LLIIEFGSMVGLFFLPVYLMDDWMTDSLILHTFLGVRIMINLVQPILNYLATENIES
jgi:anthranilate phosphoribosyltransferase